MSGLITGDLTVTGTLTVGTDVSLPTASITNSALSANAAIARSKLAQDVLEIYPVNLTDFRVWDAMQTNLPGTSAADDLGLYGGTFGTNTPKIKTYDVKAAGAVTLYARVMVPIPIEYDDAQTIQLRVRAGMETTVADVSATVDVQAYERVQSGGAVGSDLVSTSAQSINSLTFAAKDFTIDGTNLVGGDWLDVRITVAVNDAATATAVVASISEICLLADVKG